MEDFLIFIEIVFGNEIVVGNPNFNLRVVGGGNVLGLVAKSRCNRPKA